jgi:hypothetical protein
MTKIPSTCCAASCSQNAENGLADPCRKNVVVNNNNPEYGTLNFKGLAFLGIDQDFLGEKTALGLIEACQLFCFCC